MARRGLRAAAVRVAAVLVGAAQLGCAGEAAPGASAPPGPAVPAATAAQPTPGTPAQATAAAPRFDSARAWVHLQRQVGFGPRPSGSPALARARQYLVAQLETAGLTVAPQTFTAATPAGPIAMTNLVATIPGRRTERIVLASHYDTKVARDFRFVGANDGASSTAALLELGRVLRRPQPEFTIELLFLDGEEAVNWNWAGTDNTYGSRHYVAAAQKDGSLARIKALILLDMIGDRDLLIRRDSLSTPWLVDLVWGAAARIGHAGTFSRELTTVEDDHVPFLRAGVPAVDIIDLDNPTWHTAQDDIDHVRAESLQIVGDVVMAALPDIEARLTRQTP